MPHAVTVVPVEAERQLADHAVVGGRGQYLAFGLEEMYGYVSPPSTPAALTDGTLFLDLSQGIATVHGTPGTPS